MTRSNSISLLSIVMDVSTKKVPKTLGKMIFAIMFLISRVLLCQLNDPFYFNILFLFPGFNTLFYFWGFLWFLLYFGVYFCFRVSFPSVLHLVSIICIKDFPWNILILGSRLRIGPSEELDQKLWVLEITDNNFEYMTGDYRQQASQQVMCMDFSRGGWGGVRGREGECQLSNLRSFFLVWSEFPKKSLPVPSLEGLVPSAQGSWAGNRAKLLVECLQLWTLPVLTASAALSLKDET